MSVQVGLPPPLARRGKRTLLECSNGAESGLRAWRELSPPCESLNLDAKQVQREFIDLANAQCLFALVHIKTQMTSHRQIDVQCGMIASLITTIVSFSGRDAASAKFFEAVVQVARQFSAAVGRERAQLIDATSRAFVRFGSQLHSEAQWLRSNLIDSPPADASACAVLINDQALAVYKILIGEIAVLRAMIEGQLAVKHDADQHTINTSAAKRRVFCEAIRCDSAVAAAPSTSDLQCCVCSRDYSDTVERLTLSCCQHKQALCRDCFVDASYQNSQEGVKTFAQCPFCRGAYDLYSSNTAPALSAAK